MCYSSHILVLTAQKMAKIKVIQKKFIFCNIQLDNGFCWCFTSTLQTYMEKNSQRTNMMA